jgi:diguanylate cyclase (GGDEF)-like protein/PAS domain S-box-containing protein
VSDRAELLESALDALGEGAALADVDGQVVFWNRAAEMITGHRGPDVIGRPVRHLLESMIVGGAGQWVRLTDAHSSNGGGVVFRVRHALGYELPVVVHVLTVRDGMGTRIGSEALFHPADKIDALPHGDSNDDARISESQTQLEDRLARLHEDFDRGELPLGVLWVMVDQAAELRRSHGSRACEAMLESIQRTLASGLKPTEEIGRWGSDEFLVLSHEHNAAALASHAQILAGLARTAEFRWWGDRISLTVSIGAAQAERGEALCELLERAQSAMLASIRAGGNHITAAREKG